MLGANLTSFFHSSLLQNYIPMRFHCSHPGCNAMLKTKWSYQQHMKRHSGIYIYQCPYCEKGLNATKDIKHHLKSYHTGLWGFHCNKCQQDMNNVHHLKSHLQENSCSWKTASENAITNSTSATTDSTSATTDST